jgi:hypothetical protein
VYRVDRHGEGLALTQRRADLQPHKGLDDAVHAMTARSTIGPRKVDMVAEANGQLKPRALDLVIEIGKWEVDEVTHETLKAPGRGERGAQQMARSVS